MLVSDGSDSVLLAGLRSALKAEGATLEVVGPTRAGVIGSDGGEVAVDHRLNGGPSILFDAVVLAPTREGVEALLLHEAAAVQWVKDAWVHLKVIGYLPAAGPLVERANVESDEGVVALAGRGLAFAEFIERAKRGRIWRREPKLRATA